MYSLGLRIQLNLPHWKYFFCEKNYNNIRNNYHEKITFILRTEKSFWLVNVATIPAAVNHVVLWIIIRIVFAPIYHKRETHTRLWYGEHLFDVRKCPDF